MSRQANEKRELILLIRELSAPLEPIPPGAGAAPGRLAGVRAVIFDVYGTLFVSGSGDIDASGASPAALDDALAGAGGRDLNPVAAGEQAFLAAGHAEQDFTRVIGANFVLAPEGGNQGAGGFH